MTKGFVDSAITIEDRLLSISECRRILCAADELDDSVFNHITKLQHIVSRCRTPEMISWVVRHLWDMQTNQQFKSGGYPSLRHLLGQNSGESGKGLLDLIMFKQEVLTFLCENWLPKLEIDIKNNSTSTIVLECWGG